MCISATVIIALLISKATKARVPRKVAQDLLTRLREVQPDQGLTQLSPVGLAWFRVQDCFYRFACVKFGVQGLGLRICCSVGRSVGRQAGWVAGGWLCGWLAEWLVGFDCS